MIVAYKLVASTVKDDTVLMIVHRRSSGLEAVGVVVLPFRA